MTQRSIGLSFDGLSSDQARIILDAYDRAVTAGSGAQVEVRATEQAVPLAQQATSAAPAAVAQFPSAPAASAHPAPAPSPAQPPAATERDAFAVPYNADLHATRDGESGGKLQSGRWKMKRGANRTAYDAWHHQHAQQGSAPAQPQAPTFPQQGNGAGEQAPTFPSAPAPEFQQSAPAAFQSAPGGFPQAPFAPAPQPQPTIVTEAEFMAKAQQLHHAGRLPADVASRIILEAGATDNVDLVKTEHKRQIGWAAMLRIENSIPIAA